MQASPDCSFQLGDLVLGEFGGLHQGVVSIVFLVAAHPPRASTLLRNPLLVEPPSPMSRIKLEIRRIPWAGDRWQRFGADTGLVQLRRPVPHRR